MDDSLLIWRRPGNPRRSSPDSNRETYPFPASKPAVLKGLLDYGQLALINLEVDNFPGLRFFAGQMPFDLSFKPLLGQFLGFVQPGCTIEPFSIFPRHLDQLGGLAPAHLPKLLFRNSR